MSTKSDFEELTGVSFGEWDRSRTVKLLPYDKRGRPAQFADGRPYVSLREDIRAVLRAAKE